MNKIEELIVYLQNNIAQIDAKAVSDIEQRRSVFEDYKNVRWARAEAEKAEIRKVIESAQLTLAKISAMKPLPSAFIGEDITFDLDTGGEDEQQTTS